MRTGSAVWVYGVLTLSFSQTGHSGAEVRHARHVLDSQTHRRRFLVRQRAEQQTILRDACRPTALAVVAAVCNSESRYQ